MSRSVCFTELIKDENGFYKAEQTLKTACIRTFLKENGVESTVYVDEAIPSINDMCDDILSLSDEVIIFVVHNECIDIMKTLITSIMQLEDVETYVIGESVDIEDVINIDSDPGKKIAEALDVKIEDGVLDMLSVSPYEKSVLLPRDAEKYGVWIGNSNDESRKIAAIQDDINELVKVYSGLSESKQKVISFKGYYVKDKKILNSIVELVSKIEIPFLKFLLPVDETNFDEAYEIAKSNIMYSLKFENSLDEEKTDKLIKLINERKIYEVCFNTSLLMEESKFISTILSAKKANLIKISPVGELDSKKLSPEVEEIILDNTRNRYLPFFRGFINSRVGSYPVNKLDGYVRHLEVSKEFIEKDNDKFLNEVMNVNSSVYLKNESCKVDYDKWFFNEYGVADVDNKSVQAFVKSNTDKNVNVSNVIEVSDNKITNNSLAYVSKGKVYEVSYKEGKRNLDTIKKVREEEEESIYIFKLTDAEDFSLFLEDAEKYKETHKLTDLLLGYGYLENSCRFLHPAGCSADKIPRLKVDNNGGIHTCDLNVKASSKVGDSLFEIEHNSMTQRAKKLNSRGCYECPTRIWCAKCSEMPDFMSEKYCEIMKKKTYVLDYVIAPTIVIKLKDVNRNFRKTSIEDIIVSNEYMYNYISSDLKGEASPYLPKFTSLLSIDGKYLLWSPSTAKYYSISIQFAYVIELLLRRVKAGALEKLLSKMLKIDEENSKKIVDIVLETLKKAGVLYREVK